ncbi:DegT/DnrJ/EryC1/StrS aminotransferase [Actinobacteria bacterium OK074]|nr:DegT/DnrJ/EryC1/StrS aminotransferase [Actinobacteria bacterium OK074]
MRTALSRLALDGGAPVRDRPWPSYENGDNFIAAEDEEEAVTALRERRYFRYDDRPYHATHNGRLNERISALLSSRHMLACTSGTAVIALSLFALGLPPGSPVACPAFTFSAAPSAIMLVGHRPVLVGVEDDLHLDVVHLRRLIEAENVRAVVVVHVRGFASDIRAVLAAADAAGIPVVEDAVPVLGVSFDGRPLGTFGAFGAFSTQADKPVNTGEGGFLVTDDSEAYARAVVHCGGYEGRMARHFPDGAPPVSDQDHPHFAWRMDEVRAALAHSMLGRLPQRLARHRRTYDALADVLDGHDGLSLRAPSAPGAYTGQFLTMRLDRARAQDSEWYAEALCAEGIKAVALGSTRRPNARAFWNWCYLVGSDAEAARASLPHTARRIDRIVDIPLSAHLTADDRADLVRAIDKVHAAWRRRCLSQGAAV